eukprot:142541-Alexandrium_andersonii.AAC.1
MSASLVGSEMCIRDSPTPSQTPLGSPSTPFEQPIRSRIRNVHEQVPQHCLLYTSDAADDM